MPKHAGSNITLSGYGRISQSVERDHGVAVMYPMIPVVLLGECGGRSYIDAAHQSSIWHIYIYLVSFTAVLALYSMGKTLFKSRKAALLASAVFMFSPRFFAEIHYNNKDVLLLVLTVDMLALCISVADGRRKTGSFSVGKIILLSFTGGLVMNTKVAGIALVILFGLLYISLMVLYEVPVKKIILVSASTLCMAGAFYVMLTPAMWGGIRGVLSFHKYLTLNAVNFARWNGNILFEGELYKHSVNPLPPLYLLKMILFTTPLYITVLFAAGMAALLVGLFREKKKFFKKAENLTVLFCAAEFAGPITFATIFRVHVYNGWRHFYFTYLGIAMVGVYGAVRLTQMLKGKTLRKIFELSVTLCILLSVAGIAINHPFEHSYYNFLVSNASERYEMDYWNVGDKSVLKAILKDSSDTAGPVKVSATDANSMQGLQKITKTYDLRDKIWLFEEPSDAAYVVENVSYAIIAGKPVMDAEQFEILEKLYSYGNEVYVIYKHK